MRIALPLYVDDVAPRFCSADRIRLVDVEDARVMARNELVLSPGIVPERLVLLRQLGVGVLICGGFNRRFLPLAFGQGIRVYWGLTGRADNALNAFLDGRLLPAEPNSGPGRGRGGSRGGQCRRRGRAEWRPSKRKE